MTEPDQLRHELRYFTGTENWYRCAANPNIIYTDGVKFFVDEAGAYWLLDILATQPEILSTMREGFASISLFVRPGNTASLICDDGNGNVTYQREIEYTDCPEGAWNFYFADNVILLPSEY